MIKEATYYEVVCDHCGEKLSIEGVCAWETEEEALEAANYAGWQEKQDDTIICDSCLETDEVAFGFDSEESRDLYDE